ncbi:MAG: tetratricopeptide repeat protein, partial [Paramuribaculum sp.]|nr:tetratricopeptide repeat protein [Paramuribaculum sp.]
MKIRPLLFAIISLSSVLGIKAQINTDQVLQIGRNALYFEDYVLSIQYFNQVIAAKPYLAQPYFFRALAKYNLEDYKGAETDVSTAIEHNPFITDAYELRGVVRQNLGRNKEAIDDYTQALNLLPGNRGILYNKALAQEEMKDYDGAEQSYKQLLNEHPNFEGGYLGRAKLYLSKGDTISAIADVDKALSINKNAVNAYVLRADIAINSQKNYAQALEDMNEAIKLQPKYAGYFINRAFLRYKLDDYFGAMSDYDYAIQLDPTNYMAMYNRALLKVEVHDYNRAIDDLNQVLLMRPHNYRALYNRAVVYRQIGDYEKALADINEVIGAFPDLAAAVFVRGDIKQAKGDKSANKDFDKALALAKQRIKKSDDVTKEVNDMFDSKVVEGDSEPQEVVASRFSSLLTVNNDTPVEQEFNNKSIRGKIQDRNISIDMEPMFELSYYTSPTELKPSGDYLREADKINNTRALRFMIQVTNRPITPGDEAVLNQHFNSVEYYNSYLSTHNPRAIDYFGRAMDYLTLHNYNSAIADFSNAIALSPDFTLAYFMRSIAKYRLSQTYNASSENSLIKSRMDISGALEDLEQVIKFSPDMPIAYFNKGVILASTQDYTSALSAFNKAIELSPDFGEAY